MIIKYYDIFGIRGRIKMASNPPQSVVDADFHIILDGVVMHYVGIGWITVREATVNDYDVIPQVFIPHCSHCVHYDVLENKTMFCSDLQKRITARKKPCKKYSER